jgi:hypothetical protein
MIATNPYYFGGSSCRCTWTVCQCYTSVQTYTYQTQYISSWYEIAPLPKAKSNKQRMDSLRLRAYRYVPERVWLPQRPVRPSIQALSMRIR